MAEVRGTMGKGIDRFHQESNVQQSRSDKKDERDMDYWLNYLTHGMDQEPRTTEEMMQQSFKATGRSMVFMGWVYYKTFGFMIRIIRRMLGMVFRRGKKEEKGEEIIELPRLPSEGTPAQLPLAFERPQPLPAQPAQPAQPAPPQPAPPAQPEPPAQPPALPQEIQQLPAQPLPVQPAPPPQQPSPPQPPAQPPQQPAPAPAPPKPEVRENPFNLIARAIRNIDERMRLVEDAVDQIIDRLNMVQGVQPMVKKRIRFTRFGGA